MRNVLRILVAVLFAGAFPIAAVPPAAAEEPSAYGWWYRLNTRQARNPLGVQPTHPGVPEDGMFVARDVHPDEPLAISAMNVLAPSGAGAVLELKIEPNSVAGVPEVAACPMTSAFFGDRPGFWEDRPLADCSFAVDGELIETDGDPEPESMIWHLPKEFEVFPEFWNFALVPTVNTTEEPFQVAFQKPSDASFSVIPSNDPQTTPPPAPTLPPFSGTTGTPSFGGPTFAPPPATLAPAPTPAPQATPPAPDEGIRTAAAPIDAPDDTVARFVAAAVLVAIGGALAWLQWNVPAPAVAAASGGAAGAAATATGPRRGLGRFQRPRQAPPTRLL